MENKKYKITAIGKLESDNFEVEVISDSFRNALEKELAKRNLTDAPLYGKIECNEGGVIYINDGKSHIASAVEFNFNIMTIKK